MFRRRTSSAPPVLDRARISFRALFPGEEARLSASTRQNMRRGLARNELGQMPPAVLQRIVGHLLELGSESPAATTGPLTARGACRLLNEHTLVVLAQRPDLSHLAGCGYLRISANPKDRVDIYTVAQHSILRRLPHTLIINSSPGSQPNSVRPTLQEDFARGDGCLDQLRQSVPSLPQAIAVALEMILEPSSPHKEILQRRHAISAILHDDMSSTLRAFPNLQYVKFTADKSALTHYNVPQSRNTVARELEDFFVGGLEHLWLSCGLRSLSISELHITEPDCTFDWDPLFFDRLPDVCRDMPLRTLSLRISAKCCPPRQVIELGRLASVLRNPLQHLYFEYLQGDTSAHDEQCAFCPPSDSQDLTFAGRCAVQGLTMLPSSSLDTLALHNVSLPVEHLVDLWTRAPSLKNVLLVDHVFSAAPQDNPWEAFWSAFGMHGVHTNLEDEVLMAVTGLAEQAQNDVAPPALRAVDSMSNIEYRPQAVIWFLERVFGV